MKVPKFGAILLGCIISLVAHGYQFGQSNHSVYLIDALRRADPTLLANDWFYTQTLQYHSAFAWFTAALLKLRILEPAFLLIYLALVVAMHISWRNLISAIGGDDRAYLLAVVFYYLSAGGIGLGTYQFLQDSSVLASNIANVAMLCGIAAFVRGRWLAAGLGLAIAGLTHANHAVVAIALWTAFALYANRMNGRKWLAAPFIIASALVASGCLINLIPAAIAKWRHPVSLPLDEFIDIYVKLRHPHHYDPSSWSWAQWLAFCFWIPPAVISAAMLRSHRDRLGGSAQLGEAGNVVGCAQDERGRFVFVLVCILAIQLFALLFAGIFYVSETIVQLSLFRFSIYAHVMLVMLAAALLVRFRIVSIGLPVCLVLAVCVTLASPFATVAKARIGPMLALVALSGLPAVWPLLSRRDWAAETAGVAAGVALLFSFRFVTGLTYPFSKTDADYLALCRWASDTANTPRDAVFLTSPVDEDWRWTARRAIVVNWKSAPQLAGELPEWCRRIAASLGLPNLDALPRRSYVRVVEEMRRRYDELPAAQYFVAANEFGARFVVAPRDLGAEYQDRRVGPAFGRYRLYDAAR